MNRSRLGSSAILVMPVKAALYSVLFLLLTMMYHMWMFFYMLSCWYSDVLSLPVPSVYFLFLGGGGGWGGLVSE